VPRTAKTPAARSAGAAADLAEATNEFVDLVYSETRLA
jgi:hypothetical protein